MKTITKRCVQFPRLLFSRLLLAVIFTSSGVDAAGPQPEDGNWKDTAEVRLKEIYERGAFRAKDLQAQWLADNSGVVTREVDETSRQSAAWLYSIEGERTPKNEAGPSPLKTDLSVTSDGTRQVVFKDRKLILLNTATKEEIILVKADVNRDIYFRGASWSPDETRVVFVEADVTEVRERAVLVPGDPSYPQVQQHRFARVAGEIEKLRVGVVKADGTGLRWLAIEIPAEGGYLGQVEWAGNSEEVLVERFSRFRDRRDFLLFGPDGGQRVLFAETNPAWVESSQGKNSGLMWVHEGQSFVVITERDGWRHAVLVGRDGKEICCLTPGDYDLIDRAHIDEDRGFFYFYSSPDDATQKSLYRVPLDGSGTLTRVSPLQQIGTHNYVFSPNGRWAIHTFSSLDSPPAVELIEVEGHRVIRVLEDHGTLRQRMTSLIEHPTEFLKLPIGDGITLDAWMIKPRGFDSSKKYPVFIYVYGEPHAQTVLNEWGAAQIDFHRLVAELGYVVVSIDNRGTPAPKGAAWRRTVFGSLGPISTEEQEAGLKELAKQFPFVDLSRVGIWGWSGGGSNTLNALFRKPDTYHVGIAVVPKPQPHLYNAWFQEIFMRTPEVNPEGYKTAAAINYAEGLKGKLLIITGSGETNTHIQIIEGLVDKLIAMGKSFDYMVYPNRDHALREGEGTMVHVRMRIIRYLLENLPAGPQ